MVSKAGKYGQNKRLTLVLYVLFCCFIALMARLFYLQTNVGRVSDFVDKADSLIMDEVYESALRGIITDREGEPLAVSSPVSAIVVNPKLMLKKWDNDFKELQESCKSDAHFSPDCDWVNVEDLAENVNLLAYHHDELMELAKLLDMNVYELTDKIERRASRGFYYLKRQVPPATTEAIMNLHLAGISREDGFQRFYPDGELMGQIVGFTDIQDIGASGLEKQYNDWLSGQKGKKIILTDVSNRPLRVLRDEIATAQGQNLQLSIDKRIQYIMRRELIKTLEEFNAKTVSAVMVDVKTGEILGMVSLPDGNPNNKAERASELIKNRSLSDAFEPGSTIKPIAVAAALDTSVITSRSIFPTKGYLGIGSHVVKDTHNYGTLDTTGVIRKSSNVGMAMISQKLPRDTYYQFLQNMGFGQKTSLDFPGESGGRLRDIRKMGDFSYATTLYGYGISTTALQLAHAYATLANHGVKVPLTLLKRESIENGKRVLSERTAKTVVDMMGTVVQSGGTGTRANTESYTVAGKTGTTHKVLQGSYAENKYYSIFAGFAPVNNSRISLVVVVDEPQGESYYGGLVAAPAFSRITEATLKILGVLPDRISRTDELHLEIDPSVFDDNDSAGVEHVIVQ